MMSFSIALQQLRALAHQNSFTIQNVLYDGNCMFSAISYQLQNTIASVCNASLGLINMFIGLESHTLIVTNNIARLSYGD